MIDFSNIDWNDPTTYPWLTDATSGSPASPAGPVATTLGDVNIGAPISITDDKYKNIDALIKSRTPQALDLIRGSSEEAMRLAELAGQEQRSPLESFLDSRAFDEQNALLGLSGAEAQQAAIGNIPVSEFDRELNRRQSAQQQRQAFASGDVSGASLLAGQQLGAQQQANIIQNRLSELEPLVSTERGLRTSLADIDEASRARQAQLLSGRGTQLANIRIGAAAPLIEGIQNRASISGLQTIADAQAKQGQLSALSGLAGNLSQAFQPQINHAVNQGGFQRAGFGTDEFGLSAFQDPFA
jgi:hypothetical protein